MDKEIKLTFDLARVFAEKLFKDGDFSAKEYSDISLQLTKIEDRLLEADDEYDKKRRKGMHE